MGEVRDYVGSMVLGAPRFIDKTGFYPDQDVNSEFFALIEGFKTIQKRLGEDNYQKVVALAQRAKALFEADPDNKTGDTKKGRECLFEIEDILKAASRRKR
jgi:hypothetical protein